MKTRQKLIIGIVLILISGCFFQSKKYVDADNDQHKRFYDSGKSLIIKGRRLDMKYTFMDTSNSEMSMFEIYFKNQEYENINEIDIYFKTLDEGEQIEKKVSLENVNVFQRAGFSKKSQPSRFIQFDLKSFLSEYSNDEKTVLKGLDEIELNQILPEQIKFEFHFDEETEIFDFKVTNKLMLEYKLKKISKPSIEIFNNYASYDMYDANNEYYLVFNNCYYAYYYDKVKWKELVNECYDSIISSKNMKNILSDDRIEAISIFYPFNENNKRTADDCRFVYNSLKRLYKGKTYIPTGGKKTIVEYFEKINKLLHFVDEVEMNRLLNLDWNNDKNDFDELIFKWE